MTFGLTHHRILILIKRNAAARLGILQPRTLAILLTCLYLGFGPACAQDGGGIPGLIVSVPTSNSGTPTSLPGTSTGSSPTGSQPTAAVPGLVMSAPTAPKKPQTNKTRASASNARPRRKKSTTRRKKHSVAILVNDEPITHHEINQRARLLSMNTGNLGAKVKANFQALIKRKSTNRRLRAILQEVINANPGKSRDQILAIFEKRKQRFARQLQRQALASTRASMVPTQRKRAQKELTEERLKMQEARRLNVLASLADVDRAIADIAKRNKISSKKFLANLKRNGIDAQTFKDKIRAQISWNGVIRRKFGRTISVNMADVDSHIAKASGADDIKLRVQKITLKLPSNLSQRVVAARLKEGERLQSRFGDCRSSKVLAQSVKGSSFQDLGQISANKIPEPARSLLVQAKDGEMLPPLTQTEGVVLYIMCGRNVRTAKAKARSALQRREFKIMGSRHLADLKRDAAIEYR